MFVKSTIIVTNAILQYSYLSKLSQLLHSVVPRRREDTHRKFNPATDMNYSSSPPSLQKGEGQLTP